MPEPEDQPPRAPNTSLPGFRTFVVIWCGQLVSLIGSGLSRFALGVWAYQKTGSATQFTLILLAGSLPVVLLSSVSGPLVDRWDRRKTMILSDTVAAVPTIAIVLWLLLGQDLEMWHLYLAVGISSATTAFQWPAYAASTTLLVPKVQLARAAGMVELAGAGAQIFAPMVAGVLMLHFELWSLLVLDTSTFLFAVLMLLVIHIPRPAESAESQEAQGSLWQEAQLGWRYLHTRPGLLHLLGYFSFLNFSVALVLGLITPMILSFATSATLGMTLSTGAFGMLLGGLALTIWGGPQHKILSVLGFSLPLGIGLILVGVHPSPLLIIVGLFTFNFSVPIINGCSQAIWQAKIPPDLQGRVFAIRRMFATCTAPLGYLLAGPLADQVFEPLLVEGGLLAGNLGQMLGVGPGRGIGLMFILQGGLTILIAGLGFLSPRLMHIEEELPDSPAEPA